MNLHKSTSPEDLEPLSGNVGRFPDGKAGRTQWTPTCLPASPFPFFASSVSPASLLSSAF